MASNIPYVAHMLPSESEEMMLQTNNMDNTFGIWRLAQKDATGAFVADDETD